MVHRKLSEFLDYVATWSPLGLIDVAIPNQTVETTSNWKLKSIFLKTLGAVLNLFDAIRNNLNIEIVVDTPRYQLDGWFFQGEGPVKCPECSTAYKVFRCPYSTSKGEYKYWAVVCDGCETASTLDDIPGLKKNELMKWDKE